VVFLPIVGACNPAEDLAGSLEPTGPPIIYGGGVAAADVCDVPRAADTSEVDLGLDVPYRVPGAPEQKLSAMVPRNRTGLVPAVIFIHGGGWVSGTPDQYGFDMLRLAKLGYASVSVGYRLAPANKFPTPLSDVRCAIRWVRTTAKNFDVDTTRLVVAGTSAGGHLAAMVGLTANESTFDGDCPYRNVSARVSGVVAVAAPTDLRASAPYTDGLTDAVEDLLGAKPASAAALAAAASPITYVRAGAPPFLLLHGTADKLVPVRQAELFHDALRGAGASVTLMEMPGVGHGLLITDNSTGLQPSSCAVIGFLRRTFGK
jgi:acetyl esterase/lipase